MTPTLDVAAALPNDGYAGVLVGRAWGPGDPAGPSVVAIRADGVYDISAAAATCAWLLDMEDPATIAREARGKRLGDLAELLENSVAGRRDPTRPYLLAPVDLQAIKACGVTFATSLLERLIEERAGGDPAAADDIRVALVNEIGADLSEIQPGSAAADQLKESLRDRGLWSQYMEVGIGPYAEVFTKAQPMSAVGTGADVGLHPDSHWNNPEPEVALVVNSRGEAVGATLGNDVNLRDFEGLSALLLGKSKDNNGSCALGPFIRLFDESFGMDDVRAAEVRLRIEGDDGFALEGMSSMSRMSRDPLDLVAQTMGAHHQYPDGLALFLGTMFAPTEDRGEAGLGFTHKGGDLVTISTPRLGALVNRVDLSTAIEPWTFGAGALMHNLAQRGLL